jgi:hypothetical protein
MRASAKPMKALSSSETTLFFSFTIVIEKSNASESNGLDHL